jgi:hypothetical protein
VLFPAEQNRIPLEQKLLCGKSSSICKSRAKALLDGRHFEKIRFKRNFKLKINLKRDLTNFRSIHQHHLQPSPISWDYPCNTIVGAGAVGARAALRYLHKNVSQGHKPAYVYIYLPLYFLKITEECGHNNKNLILLYFSCSQLNWTCVLYYRLSYITLMAGHSAVQETCFLFGARI